MAKHSRGAARVAVFALYRAQFASGEILLRFRILAVRRKDGSRRLDAMDFARLPSGNEVGLQLVRGSHRRRDRCVVDWTRWPCAQPGRTLESRRIRGDGRATRARNARRALESAY